MGLPNSPAAYEDVREAMDKALNAERGIRAAAANHGAAVHLRHRMYKLRIIDRKASEALYPVGDNRRGTSPYDALTLSVEETDVLIRKGVSLPTSEL